MVEIECCFADENQKYYYGDVFGADSFRKMQWNQQLQIDRLLNQNFEFLSSAYEDDEDDEEQVEIGSKDNRLLRGLASLLDFLPGGDKSILGMLRNVLNFRDSPMYRPAGAGVFGYSPAQLNQMNALGGFYSEPMREMRRRSNRISNMLQRAAAGKSYSEKNLQNLMNQFDMGDTDVGGMIQSIKQSSDMGYE